MRTLLTVAVLLGMCLSANAEQKVEDYLNIAVGMRGSNVVHVLAGRTVSRDRLFHQLNRVAKFSTRVRVVVHVDSKIPVGILHDLHRDVKQIGFNDVDCILLRGQQPPRKIAFADSDIEIEIVEPPDPPEEKEDVQQPPERDK